MRLLLQQGVKPSWLEAPLGGEEEAVGDLRDHFVAPEGLPSVGETGVGEILLKTLQPHRMAGEASIPHPPAPIPHPPGAVRVQAG